MNDKNEFDMKAKTWDSQPDRISRTQVFADAIIEEIPFDSSATAMEYGCGTGLLSFPLKDRFSKITLIDSSDGMLEVVKEKIAHDNIRNVEVIKADLQESIPNVKTTFSVIYNSMVLHHIDNIDSMLSIWYSLLSTPGYLYVIDLDLDKGLFHGKDFKGHNGFDREELGKKVVNAGFTDVRFKTIYEMRKEGNDGFEHLFPLFLMVAKKQDLK